MWSFGIPFAFTFTARFFSLVLYVTSCLLHSRTRGSRKSLLHFIETLKPTVSHIRYVLQEGMQNGKRLFIPGRTRLVVAGGHPRARLHGRVAHVGVHFSARPIVPADGMHHHVPTAARRRASAKVRVRRSKSLFHTALQSTLSSQ